MAKIHHPELEEPLSSQREPVFNAVPWPAVALVATIIGGYFLQSFVAQDPLVLRWGYSPARGGHPETLVTAIFLHKDWAHALTNGAFALAFAAPVAGYFGVGPRGAAALDRLACCRCRELTAKPTHSTLKLRDAGLARKVTRCQTPRAVL